MKIKYFLTLVLGTLLIAAPVNGETYAEKLGWGAEDKVVILHVDDVGMCHDANMGAVKALTQGVASSSSVLMCCPWIPEYAAFLRENPDICAGVELAFNSEYKNYRWGPVAGATAVPGLVDEKGYMWETVEETVAHASSVEIEAECRAQIARARALGIEPSHLDSHMGTIFEKPSYFAVYIKLALEKDIPVMLPAGHTYHARLENPESKFDIGVKTGKMLWDRGLPVIDDLVNSSLDWDTLDKTDQYIELMKKLKPGITQISLHCIDPSPDFKFISEKDLVTRHGDLRAMIDTRLREAIEKEGIILSNWRELKRRRDGLE